MDVFTSSGDRGIFRFLIDFVEKEIVINFELFEDDEFRSLFRISNSGPIEIRRRALN